MATHVHHSGTSSTIYLLFTSNPSRINDCITIPALSNSDHLGLLARLRLKSVNPIKAKTRSVWRYSLADWDRACKLIEATDWNSLLDHSHFNISWNKWKSAFMNIMEECIPKATLPPRRNRPWLTKKLIQAIRRRNFLYKHAKTTGNYSKVSILCNMLQTPQDSLFALQKVLSIFKHQHYSSALHLPSETSPGVCLPCLGTPTPQEILILSKACKKMTSHRWSGATYEDLLTITNLPTLERRRLELKLCHLLKIIHNLVYFPSNVIVHRERPHYHFRSSHDYYLSQPFAELTLIFIHLYPISFLFGTAH